MRVYKPSANLVPRVYENHRGEDPGNDISLLDFLLRSYACPGLIKSVLLVNNIPNLIFHLLAIAEADEIVLKKQKANRFLSTHHVTKRSFNVVEECCVEGCVWEEIFEYCKPTQF